MKQTTLCYIENDGRYLMMHRTKKDNDENSGKWIGIGGKFLEGESPEDCMKREVFEETSLEICSWNYRGIVTFVSDIWETEHMHLFTAVSSTDSVCECDEGELAWIDKSKLMSLSLWEGDKIFLRYLQDEKMPFFSLKLIYSGDKLEKAVLNGEKVGGF